jgi:hypothetical protein
LTVSVRLIQPSEIADVEATRDERPVSWDKVRGAVTSRFGIGATGNAIVVARLPLILMIAAVSTL